MKYLLILFISVISLKGIAQELTIKAGTAIPIQSVNKIEAANVAEGQNVYFRVSRDINIDGITAIPYGTMVTGQIYEAKKSSWWGTRGRLGIKVNEILLPSGKSIPLNNGDIYIKGKNRTALSVILFAIVIWPACFICGGKAEMVSGYEIVTYVAKNTNVFVD